jgi:hypothetical protein
VRERLLGSVDETAALDQLRHRQIELVSSSFAQRSGCLTGRVDLFAAG